MLATESKKDIQFTSWLSFLETVCKKEGYFLFPIEEGMGVAPVDSLWFNYVTGDVHIAYWKSDYTQVEVNKEVYEETQYPKYEDEEGKYIVIVPFDREFRTYPLYKEGELVVDEIKYELDDECYTLDLRLLHSEKYLPTVGALYSAYSNFNATRRLVTRGYWEGSAEEQKALKGWVKKKITKSGKSLYKKYEDLKELKYFDISTRPDKLELAEVRESPNYKHLDKVLLDYHLWSIRTHLTFDQLEEVYPIEKTMGRYKKLKLNEFTCIFKYYWFKDQLENRTQRRRTYEKG